MNACEQKTIIILDNFLVLKTSVRILSIHFLNSPLSQFEYRTTKILNTIVVTFPLKPNVNIVKFARSPC